jgi:hypothetical protein
MDPVGKSRWAHMDGRVEQACVLMNEVTRSSLKPGCSSRMRLGISSLDRVIEDRVTRLQAGHISVNLLW